MDYLDEQEDKGQKIECINRLRQRKQDLVERLEKLRTQKFEIDVQDPDKFVSDDVRDVSECRAILDIYRLHGVCIKSMGPDLVLRFDPLYRNQYPNSEHYSVQLHRKGDNFKLGKHNLPPFIPASELLEKCLGNGIEEVVEKIRKLLYAYIQRREGFKQAKKTFEDKLEDDLELDLAVTYVKFQIRASAKFPQMEVTLQYSLDRCLPDTVEVTPVSDEETQSVSRKTLEQTKNEWRQTLFNKDIFTALSDILKRKS